MRRKLRTAKAVLRPARVPEKAEQAHIVQLLRSVGGQVYVMGTTRRRGDYAGTMQTEGIPDLMAFLPARNASEALGRAARVFLFVEVKARGGRLRPEQIEFQTCCVLADVAHITGGLDAVIAWLAERGYITADSVPHYRQPPAQA
jgi:hypothetical protein